MHWFTQFSALDRIDRISSLCGVNRVCPISIFDRLIRQYWVNPFCCLSWFDAGLAGDAAAAIKKHVKFANCAAMNKEFPHGVAKAKGLGDKNKKGKVLAHGVKTYLVVPGVYNQNKALDTDKDGIVCEKL